MPLARKAENLASMMGLTLVASIALGVPLDLVDLRERLERLPPERLGAVRGVEELPAAAQVRVVRDDDGVAADPRLETRVLDGRPEALRDPAGRGLDVARYRRRNTIVAEDDVSVQVGAERARRVLVAKERRERAGIGPVVGALGGRLHLLPHRDRRAGAMHAGITSEGLMRR